MKLINISKTSDTYIVKAFHPFKILGFQFYTKVKSYKYDYDSKEWQEVDGKKEVAKEYQIKLNRWLEDHQKFIEKS